MLKSFFNKHPFLSYILGILLATIICGYILSTLFMSGNILLTLIVFVLYIAMLIFLLYKISGPLSKDEEEFDMYSLLETKIEKLKSDSELLPKRSKERLELLKQIKTLIEFKEEIDSYE